MDSIVTTEDTIAAIASAISIGKGGVAIIRVSGKDSINSCKKIVQTNSKYAWESHRVFHGFIQENKQNKFIDEVLILVMKSPNSFTGEDVVELHCHGGIIIVNKVLKLLLSSNSRVRIANPGEFSQRAFLNGKIDLTSIISLVVPGILVTIALSFFASKFNKELLPTFVLPISAIDIPL